MQALYQLSYSPSDALHRATVSKPSAGGDATPVYRTTKGWTDRQIRSAEVGLSAADRTLTAATLLDFFDQR